MTFLRLPPFVEQRKLAAVVEVSVLVDHVVEVAAPLPGDGRVQIDEHSPDVDGGLSEYRLQRFDPAVLVVLPRFFQCEMQFAILALL